MHRKDAKYAKNIKPLICKIFSPNGWALNIH
jgi:hypothetical protein